LAVRPDADYTACGKKQKRHDAEERIEEQSLASDRSAGSMPAGFARMPR